MRSAVLFDLDGTLWDSVAQVTPAWRRLLAPYGLNFTQTHARSLMGKTAAQIADMLLPGLDKAQALGLVGRCCDAEVPDLRRTGGTLYPGLRETLAALRARRYFLGIVSNCQDGYVQCFLDRHGLWPYFDDYEMSGRTGLSKGENIRLVLARNRLDRAVFVGDTPGDQAAARLAGLPFYHAAYGFGQAEDPDGRVESLPALLALIE